MLAAARRRPRRASARTTSGRDRGLHRPYGRRPSEATTSRWTTSAATGGHVRHLPAASRRTATGSSSGQLRPRVAAPRRRGLAALLLRPVGVDERGLAVGVGRAVGLGRVPLRPLEYDPYFGWVWVPGYQWAPAWVLALLGRRDRLGAARSRALDLRQHLPVLDSWWTFVPTGRFVGAPSTPWRTRRGTRVSTSTRPARRRLGRFLRRARSRAVVRRRHRRGVVPAPRVIEQRIGRPLTPVRVVPAPSPGAARVGPGEVSIYRPGRPAPGRAGGRGPGPAPAPGRADGAVQVPGRGGPGGLPPVREAPGRGGQGGLPPAREAPGRGGQGGLPPAREAPGRETPGRGRGNESPPGRDSGRGQFRDADGKARGVRPAGGAAPGMPPARAGREDFAARGGARTAPMRGPRARHGRRLLAPAARLRRRGRAAGRARRRRFGTGTGTGSAGRARRASGAEPRRRRAPLRAGR